MTTRLLTFVGLAAMGAMAQNPVVQTSFTPDPAPVVVGDTLYLFTDHDEDDAQYFRMKDWQLYSTTDMINWTYRGTPLATETFKWAKQGDNAWAAQAIERNGKWYWYVAAEDTVDHLHGVGVAVADRPEGPYVDPIGKPLVPGDWGYIDPSVFIDDDDQAWLIWGNNGCWYAPLNPDMVSLAGPIKEVPGLNDPDAFGPLRKKMDYATNTEMMKTKYEEGPWLTKRNGIYYLAYAAGGVPEHMAYSTAENINGPWKFGGRIMDEAENSFTIHGGNVEFKGHNYMFYHNGGLPNGGGFRRSTCIEEFEFNPDGTIPFIPQTKEGVKPIGTLNPYQRVEAETMANSYGLKTDRTQGVNHYITSVHNGDWLKLRNVDLGSDTPKSVTATSRGGSDGATIQFRLDSLGGPIIAELPLANGSDWQTSQIEITPDPNTNLTGIHDIYLLFRGPDTQLPDLDHWQFQK